MAAASIVINQGALTPGIGGQSRDDLTLGPAIQLTNDNDDGVRGWRWALLSIPEGSAAVLSNPIAPNPTFTPDLVGTYLIELAVNEGETGQRQVRVAIIRDANGLRIPAEGESVEANYPLPGGGLNTEGYYPDLYQLLELVRLNLGGGGGGGPSSLAATLGVGNITGGTSILVSPGDALEAGADLVLNPGAGGGDQVVLDGLRWPGADGGVGEVLTTDGAGNLTFAPVAATMESLADVLIVGNTTSGTDIEVSSGDSIVGAADLPLAPGAGVLDRLVLDGLRWPGVDGLVGDVLTTDGAGNLSFGPMSVPTDTLADTLVAGNTTGGTDIIVTAGDSIEATTDLVLTPGPALSDQVVIDGLRYPSADGAAGNVLQTNGAGELTLGPVTLPGGSGVSVGVPVTTATAADLVAYVDAGDAMSYPGTGSDVTDLQGNLTNGTITGATFELAAFAFDGAAGDVSFDKGAAVDDIFDVGGTIQVFARPLSDGQNSEGHIVSTSAWSLTVTSELPNQGGSVRVTFEHGFSGTPGVWSVLGSFDDSVFRALRLGTWESIAVEYDSSSVANTPTITINGRPQRTSLISVDSLPVGVADSDVGSQLVLGNRAAGDRTYDGSIDVFLAWGGLTGPGALAQAQAVFASRHGSTKGLGSENSAGSAVFLEGGDATQLAGLDWAGPVFLRGGDQYSLNASAGAGGVFVRGGDTDIGGGGPFGPLSLQGGRGELSPDLDIGDDEGQYSGVVRGGVISSGNGLNVFLFAGVDNDDTGPGGPVTVRGGDALSIGSGNDNGGAMLVRSGRQRGGGNPGTLALRTAASSNSPATTTGDVYLTSRAGVVPGVQGTEGGITTSTGTITIDTQPGATAAGAGDISIEGGSTQAITANNPGAVSIRAGSMLQASQSLVGGADVDIAAGLSEGNNASNGGSVNVAGGDYGGTGNSDAGDINLLPGSITAGGTGRNGHVNAGRGTAIIFPAYTVVSVPPAADHPDGVIIVANEVGGRTLATSDGADWRRVSDGAIIS